jgi:hypothetical protein
VRGEPLILGISHSLGLELFFPGPVSFAAELDFMERWMARKYSKKASKKVENAMEEMKKGTLRSGKGGKGGKVKSRKQAIAIGLSEARKEGDRVPKKKAVKRKKKG